MRPLLPLALGLVVGLSPAPAGNAQTSQEERRIEEKARLDLLPTEYAILQGERRLVFDYGIWMNHQFTDFDDDDNNTSASDATDATYALDQRAWFRAVLRPPADGRYANEHSLYARVKNLQTWRDPGDENGRHDWNGPHVDYLFLTLDARPLWYQVGRRFFQVGQGLAYSNLGDGIEVLATSSLWTLMGFVSRSLPHEGNLDQSVPGGKNSGRTFYGLEGRYIGIPNHGLYSYAVFQRDDADEDPENTAQTFEYDSEYFGVGAEGKLLENLRYAAEVILETGDSVTTSDQEMDVLAWAMDVSLTYDVQLPTQPTFYAEYAFGSGDSDRVNVTDTLSGNAVGTDTNFLYFGYLPAGYALSPRISNLRMLKVGMAFKPLEQIPLFKEFTCSVDYYRYFKDEPGGGIFDLQATQTDRDVGSEIDVTLAWTVLSDLSFTLEYGHFEPGDAFPLATNDSAEYVSLSVTSTF